MQEKPLSIALREVNAGMLEVTDLDDEDATEGNASVDGAPAYHNPA